MIELPRTPEIDRVELGPHNTVIITDTAGQRMTYAQDTRGNMVLGQMIVYPWANPRLTLTLFVPLAPAAVPWILAVKLEQ